MNKNNKPAEDRHRSKSGVSQQGKRLNSLALSWLSRARTPIHVRQREVRDQPKPRLEIPIKVKRPPGIISRPILPPGPYPPYPVVASRLKEPKSPSLGSGGGAQSDLVISSEVITRYVTPANSSISAEEFGRWEQISRGQVPQGEFVGVGKDQIDKREMDALLETEVPMRVEIESYRSENTYQIRSANLRAEEHRENVVALGQQTVEAQATPNQQILVFTLKERAEEELRKAEWEENYADNLTLEARMWIITKNEEVRKRRIEVRANIQKWAEDENERLWEETIVELKAGLLKEIADAVNRGYIPGVSLCLGYEPA